MKKSTKTTHHIIPRSREGADDKCNLANVAHKQHDLYHQLFENKTPEEILEYLVSYFWKSQNGIDGFHFVLSYKDSKLKNQHGKIMYDGTTWRRITP